MAQNISSESRTRIEELQSEFLTIMSHELRTPIHGIMGLADLLSETDLDATQRELLDALRRTGRGLFHMVGDLLDFSQLQEKGIEIKREPFDLRGTVESVAEMMASEAQKKGLHFTCSVSPDVPGEMLGDRPRIFQILTNLVSNAIKFTEKGEVILRVHLLSDGRAHFQVEDSGCGIPEEDLPLVFIPFHQGDGSVTRRHGGAGLGLGVVRGLCDLMGSKLVVESAVGYGTRFSFVLDLPTVTGSNALFDIPQMVRKSVRVSARSEELTTHLKKIFNAVGCEVDREEGNEPELLLVEHGDQDALSPEDRSLELVWNSPEGVQRSKLSVPYRSADLLDRVRAWVGEKTLDDGDVASLEARGLRILVVEDNPVNQLVVRKQLEKYGHEVHVAKDGLEALKAVRRSDPFTMVLMDCHMPNMDGLEATRRIRESEHGERRLPIVALTASAIVGDRERCIAAGMDDYITKPCGAEELETVVARWSATGA